MGNCFRRRSSPPPSLTRQLPSRVVHVSTNKELNNQLKQAKDRLVVIDFYANWCQPCQGIAPMIDALSAQYPGVSFLKVDVDELNEVAMQYDVTSLPTFVFIKKGNVVAKYQESNYNKILALVNKYK